MGLSSANINSPINLNLPIVPETDDPKLYLEATKIYNALRSLQVSTTLLTGAAQRDVSEWSLDTPDQTIYAQNLNRLYGQATEVLVYGTLVNIYDQGGGILGFRKATGTGALKRAHGVCTTTAGIAIGAYGEVQIGNGLTGSISGMTTGIDYYLSLNANGLITSVAPVGAGNIRQHVGYALSPTLLYFSFHEIPVFL